MGSGLSLARGSQVSLEEAAPKGEGIGCRISRRATCGQPQNQRETEPHQADNGDPMPDIGPLLGDWGYLAIFLIVVLGNVGLPVPEETTLILAGYLVWRGELRFPIVLAVGITSAVGGDSLGYWIGRR